MKLKKTNNEVRELREKVLEIVARVLDQDYDPQQRNLELNSLKMLELIVALEEEFGIHISEDVPLARITSSVDRIVQFLLRTQPPQEFR
jgi:acyl carrier protein